MPFVIPIALAAIAAAAPTIGAAAGGVGPLAAGGALGAGAAGTAAATAAGGAASPLQTFQSIAQGNAPTAAQTGNLIGNAASLTNEGLKYSGALTPSPPSIPGSASIPPPQLATGPGPASPVGGGLAPNFSTTFSSSSPLSGSGPASSFSGSGSSGSGSGSIEDLISQVIQSITGGSGDLSSLGAS